MENKVTDDKQKNGQRGDDEHEEPRFMHQRLEVYGFSLDLAELAAQIIDDIPRGNGRLVDQMRRSSLAVPLLIGEAANRRSRAQKRQRFEEALGEAGECAVAVEVALRLGLVDEELANKTLQLAWRVVKILAKLEQNHR